MVNPPDIYDGAQFTLRYQECKDRITEYITSGGVDYPFGFMAAWVKAVDEVRSNETNSVFWRFQYLRLRSPVIFR